MMRLKNLFSFLTAFALTGVLATSDPSESQDIICHGTDCYPRIFQPTDKFQNVREDQIIPKGLHVRMDFTTGLKEAKLYDGIDHENLQAIEVFQDETTAPESMPSPAEGLDFLQSEMQRVMQPEKVDQGAIRPPPSGPDGVGFSRDTATILSASADNEAVLPALENLEDISHDIYWGLRLGQNGDVVHKLNSFIGNRSLETQIRSTAALLLGTAIQNNPAALTAALSHFYNDSHPDGPLETVMLALIHEQIPALTTRLIYLLSELCQDQQQLLRFIRGDGLSILRMLYDPEGMNPQTTDRLRTKISNFILDHFLKDDSLRGLTVAEPQIKVGSPKVEEHQWDENTWTIVDASDIPTTKEAAELRNVRASLSRWCKPFSSRVKLLERDSGTDGESATAREHASEAWTALNAKLEQYGCSCATVDGCRKSKGKH